MKKRKRDAQRTQEVLLQAAEDVFVEKGFDGARVDEIANRANINKRMIYVFFGNKEQLYIEVLRGSFRRLFQSHPPAPDENGDPIADTIELISWYFWFLSENPNYVRLLGWETLHDGSRAGQVLIDLMEEGLGPLQKMVRRGKAEGVFRKDLAVHKLVTIFNEVCLGFFSRRSLLEVLWGQDLNDRQTQQEMLDHIVKVILEGLKPREE